MSFLNFVRLALSFSVSQLKTNEVPQSLVTSGNVGLYRKTMGLYAAFSSTAVKYKSQENSDLFTQTDCLKLAHR